MTCKHLMRDAADCVFCERDRLRQELEALKRTREQEKDYANTCYENERLRSALRGLTDMYACTWDRVDGALVMLPDSIPKFEEAHRKAQFALRGAAPQTDNT